MHLSIDRISIAEMRGNEKGEMYAYIVTINPL